MMMMIIMFISTYLYLYNYKCVYNIGGVCFPYLCQYFRHTYLIHTYSTADVIYTHTHTQTHTYIHTHTNTYKYIHIWLCI